MLEKDGIFVAEGEKVVRSMMSSGCRVVSCLAAAEARPRYKELLKDIEKRGGLVYTAPGKLIGDIIGFRFHRGIMAVGRCPKRSRLSASPKISKRLLFVALNAVNDPENVGLMVRNAAAFGAQGLIVDRATYDPYYRKSIRVSMGTIFNLPVYYEDDLVSGLAWLKKNRKTRVVAATPGAGTKDITEADLSGNICLVFGNEDKGVSSDVLRIADEKVRISISDTVDSLNVASASAVFLHAANRQGKTRNP
jgi:tRNA G18 (ribose-2'-O)-methylase SpoU